MRIAIYIDRLVLEGLPLKGTEGARVAAALKAELGRLAGAQGPALDGVGAVPTIAAPPISIASTQHPTAIGHAIARSLHAGMERAE
jgi:hypothetical protein